VAEILHGIARGIFLVPHVGELYRKSANYGPAE
jgi:hypothetical protein